MRKKQRHRAAVGANDDNVAGEVPTKAAHTLYLELEELLRECLDALHSPGWDIEHRAIHSRLIDQQLINNDTLPTAVRDALVIARKALAQYTSATSLMSVDTLSKEAVSALSEALGPANAERFVYHGTVLGRLSSILRVGLKPGYIRQWSREPKLRARCEQAVFFAKSWRGAAWWADTAVRTSKGPRTSVKRKPIVIRLDRSGLTLKEDRLAITPGSLLVEGVVLITDGMVAVGPLVGIPQWIPAQNALRMFSLD